MSSVDCGLSMVEHLLFRLVFSAVADLSIRRLVPERCDVSLAEIRPESSRAQRHEPALLELRWGDREIIGYEAGFDTNYSVYGEELIEVTRNPENAWARVWWDRPPPMFDEQDGIEARIRYIFENRQLLKWALIHPSAPEATPETVRFLKRTSKALSELAEKIGLPSVLRMPKDGGFQVGPRTFATHLEAIIGAAFIDGGLRVAERVARNLLDRALRDQREASTSTAYQGTD